MKPVVAIIDLLVAMECQFTMISYLEGWKDLCSFIYRLWLDARGGIRTVLSTTPTLYNNLCIFFFFLEISHELKPVQFAFNFFVEIGYHFGKSLKKIQVYIQYYNSHQIIGIFPYTTQSLSFSRHLVLPRKKTVIQNKALLSQ